jgi:hypothetical protein
MESEGNTTIQTLGYADASSSTTPGYYPNIFDGTPEDTVAYGMVHITCQADASGTIKAMHSIDNSVWDFIDTIPYPGSDSCIGNAINIRRDLKAKWYKTQFIHEDSDVSSECNLRLTTVFHPATTPAEKHDVRLTQTVEVCLNKSVIDVCMVNTVMTVSGRVGIDGLDLSGGFLYISNDPLNVNIVGQDLSYLTISGISVTIPSISISLADVTITNDPLNVNITQQDLSFVTISGQVTSPELLARLDDICVNTSTIPEILVKLGDICVNTGTMPDIIVKLGDICVNTGAIPDIIVKLGDICINTGAIPDIIVKLGDICVNTGSLSEILLTLGDICNNTNSLVTLNDPIPQVWESDEIGDTVTAVASQLTVYTIHCMNFAPDYRFIKLYDLSGTVTITDRPKMTLPVVADVPYNMQFPNGLLFNNSLQVRATRCLRYDDANLAEQGDVHMIVTYSA